MDIAALVAAFSTGTYTVTRRARGTTVRGIIGDGTSTTLTITASCSPSKGFDLLRVPEGRRDKNGAMTIFTTTELKLGGVNSAYEADRISIDGRTWEVDHVELWTDPRSGDVLYKCIASDVA